MAVRVRKQQEHAASEHEPGTRSCTWNQAETITACHVLMHDRSRAQLTLRMQQLHANLTPYPVIACSRSLRTPQGVGRKLDPCGPAATSDIHFNPAKQKAATRLGVEVPRNSWSTFFEPTLRA